MRPGAYCLLDHTADLAMAVFVRTQSELFIHAGLAMFDVMVQGPTDMERYSHSLRISGRDQPDLMVNWLRELLYLWSGRHQVVVEITIAALTEIHLAAVVATVDFDPDRHEILREIKAVTYHRIMVEKRSDQWRAEVVFDL